MSGFKLLGGGSGLDQVVSDMNTNILELKNQDVTKIFKDDTGTPVVILDKNGLRTTAPNAGFDVTSASDSQTTFDSRRNVFKIVTKLTGSFALNATGGRASSTFTVNHNLGYKPLTVISVNITSTPLLTGLFPVPYSGFGTTSGITGAFVILTYCALKDVTNTAFTFEVGSYTGNFNGDVTIYVLQETAT